MRRMCEAVALAVALVVVAGCAGNGTTGQDGTAAADATAAPTTSPAGPGTDRDTPEPVGEVPELLAFQAPTVGGGEFDATTLAGEPVAFWFWAAWCPRCAAAAEHVKAAQAEFAGSVHVVGVAGLGSGDEAMRDFVDRHGLDDFPQLADDDGQVWQRFGVTTQEYFVILDDSGEVVQRGTLSAQALQAELASVGG